ncbi:MAG: hypothetical protein NZM11_13640, partial [Anaerolineales bacterium]|nr:hypothetical protein [Anaerolineales bacterium]
QFTLRRSLPRMVCLNALAGIFCLVTAQIPLFFEVALSIFPDFLRFEKRTPFSNCLWFSILLPNNFTSSMPDCLWLAGAQPQDSSAAAPHLTPRRARIRLTSSSKPARTAQTIIECTEKTHREAQSSSISLRARRTQR